MPFILKVPAALGFASLSASFSLCEHLVHKEHILP